MTEGEPVVFVVDDDHALCELVISMLSRTGFKVVAAFDGPTGIETARDAHPAVILLDMMMPGLDGIGTCERLKQDPVLADIPVVGMTASLSAEARVIWHDPQPVSGNRFRHGVHLTRFGHDIDLVQYRRFLNHLAAGQEAKL
jgi:CheY-like chemotaxis protein